MKENMPGRVSRHSLAYLPFPIWDLLFFLTFLKKKFIQHLLSKTATNKDFTISGDKLFPNLTRNSPEAILNGSF